ncbi:MAG: DNA-binding protein HBsu [Candidatus Ozemobacter sibiricus]|uniref:DNA-binding protein HBsu n=1 Tax=Candidatus Ozemobacter sibiricus TaxID=2268124 RepID=A0A367ZQH5_9BACT|nr:MAG: DNA-binding protein HBsu [Candidatus Ozemobacter sibiricus]
MNKSELVKTIAKKAAITNVESEAVLKAFIHCIRETLKKGEKVQLVGFGSFTTVKRAARKGVNPKTKKPINIPAKKVAKFIPGKDLKDSINKAK